MLLRGTEVVQNISLSLKREKERKGERSWNGLLFYGTPVERHWFLIAHTWTVQTPRGAREECTSRRRAALRRQILSATRNVGTSGRRVVVIILVVVVFRSHQAYGVHSALADCHALRESHENILSAKVADRPDFRKTHATRGFRRISRKNVSYKRELITGGKRALTRRRACGFLIIHLIHIPIFLIV